MATGTHVTRSSGARQTSGGSSAQQRFRRLIERVDEVREQLRTWHDAMPPFLAAYESKVRPLLERERAQVRAWTLAMDRLTVGRTLNRKDKRTLRALLHETVHAMLAEQPDDAEIAAVFKRQTGEDYETWQGREATLASRMRGDLDFPGPGEHARGTDGDSDGDWEAAEDAAANARTRARASARDRKRDLRHRAEQARLAQSARDIWRKLVSELHPDREPDEARRHEKTRLMQKVNEAYEKKDLQTLLEVQLQLEELDAGTLDALDDVTLKHYIGVLSQQVWSLEHELQDVSRLFMRDYGFAIRHRPDPERLDLVIERTCRHVRAATKEWSAQLALTQNLPALRAWLKEIRMQDNDLYGALPDRDWDDNDIPF